MSKKAINQNRPFQPKGLEKHLISRSLSSWVASFVIGHGAVFTANASVTAQNLPVATEGAYATNQSTSIVSSAISAAYGTDGLRLNFDGAPLELVLDYLSDAAGFVINKQTEVRGGVTVSSKQPVTKDEAVELLGSALRKSGYAMTRNGRILTIIALDTAKTADTEIAVGADPGTIGKSEEVQTQVIPVQFATAAQLVPNLEPLLPSSATLTANESVNTLILVASKTDIKRVLTIVKALDTAMASSSSIKVKPLRFADAKETASIITQLFAQPTTSQASQGAFGNGPNFGGGPPGGGFGGFQPTTSQNSGAANTSGRGSTSGRVTAIADERSNSVIVSAPADLLGRSKEWLINSTNRWVI